MMPVLTGMRWVSNKVYLLPMGASAPFFYFVNIYKTNWVFHYNNPMRQPCRGNYRRKVMAYCDYGHDIAPPDQVRLLPSNGRAVGKHGDIAVCYGDYLVEITFLADQARAAGKLPLSSFPKWEDLQILP